MRNTDFLRRNRLVLATLLPLGGILLACGADPASPSETRPEKETPATGDEDETSEDGSKVPEGDAPQASKPSDAGVSSSRKDAGAPAAPSTDAGSAKADAAATAVDAGQAPTDAGVHSIDGGSPDVVADATVDAGAPAQKPDASSATADAQVPAVPPHTFKVDSKAEWTASGFKVEAGQCYLIEATIDDKWLDLDVPADLSGWKDKKDARLALFEPFRRVAQADIGFYQFATCVNKKTNQCFPVNASSTVCPKVAGELFFFVNDVAGFESNNVGTATVSIRAK